MTLLRCQALLLVCLALAGRARAQESQSTLAIYPLHGLGTDAEIVARLEELVYVEMQALGTVIVVSQAEVELAVKKTGEDVCTGAPTCLAEFGRTLGADLLFYGTVASLGDSYVLDAKLMSSESGELAGRQSVTLQGNQAVMIQGIRDLAVQLVAPALYVGTLDLRGVDAGAEVQLDGLEVGTTPIRPLKNLAPGQHSLRIVKPGMPTFDRFVDVAFGHTTILHVDLSSGEATVQEPGATAAVKSVAGDDEDPAMGWLLPVGVSSAALGAAGLGAGLISATQLLLPWLAAQSYTRESEGGEIVVHDRNAYLEEVDRYRQAEGFWWLGLGLATTGGLLAAGGVAALVLWSGEDGEQGGEGE